MEIARATIEGIAKEIAIKVKMSKQDLDACETANEMQEKIYALAAIRERFSHIKTGYDECMFLFPIEHKAKAWETVNKRFEAIFAFIDYRTAIIEDELYNRFILPGRIKQYEGRTPLYKHALDPKNTTEPALAKYNEAWKALGGEVRE